MRVEVRQIWEESSEDKTGWELVQPWITMDGYEVVGKEIVVTDTDKYGHPTEGYYEKANVLEQEIRIGNIFLHNSNWSNENEQMVEHEFRFTADHWYWLGESLFDLDNISPVPLTKEWLLKFDFIKDKDRESWFVDIENGYNRFDLMFFDGVVYLKSRYSPEKLDVQALPHIKFVHQIQNLYFALTGKELEVEL